MATPSIAHESFAWEYDVFLSFRGEDTRKTFTDHLYSALHQVGIRTFRDEEELTKGEYLAPELVKAIQSSRIAVIILSKDYASSRWCLDELVEIVELKEKRKLRVFPIFYNIDPSEVRKQSGSYGMALSKHKERFSGSDKVQKWRDALTKVANMKGWDLQDMTNGYESKFINSIIKEIQWIISRVPIFVGKHEVGLDSRIEHVVQLLHGKSNDGVHMVGIFGMGGIGKTTLAKAVYNKLFVHFESSCFLEIDSTISGQLDNGINIDKVDKTIKKLHKQLFQKLLNEKIDIGSIDEEIMLMKRRLQTKKCLIVLDNLEHRNQFNKLFGGRDWFGGGSRLILTTRDAHVFKELEVDECYEAEVLDPMESLQLFSLHAFRQQTLPKEDYGEVLDGIVVYCWGLPLALEVLGSYLYDKSREEWISAFAKLKKIPNNNVQAKLKISYDGLPDDCIKSAFLDLVCFSNRVYKENIRSMCNFSSIEIRDLIDKCLIIKGRTDSWISMHDLIRKMGREIIRLESPNNPGERSRLWCPKDIHEVLIKQKGTKKIEVIIFNDSPLKNVVCKYSTEAFKDMENLRFLEISGEYIHLNGKFDHLSKELRCLKWDSCPLKYINISSGCSFEKLVNLELQNSNIKEFQTPLKFFPCLEVLDLDGSYLIRTPNFSGAQNLRKLSFRLCHNLVKVHSFIGELKKLVYLSFGGCEKLEKLPNNLRHLNSLQYLDVSFASKLKALPEIFSNLTSIQTLCLVRTNTYGVLSNLSRLSKLETIYLNFCKNIEVLPKLHHTVSNVHLDHCHSLKMIQELPLNLREFSLNDCNNVQILPQLPSNLREISLKGCYNLKMLPQFPPSLEIIWLEGSKNLKLIPELPQPLRSLTAKNCESMEKIPNLSHNTVLSVLNLSGCRKLKEIQGWENNLHIMSSMMLGGVPHIDFSESIKEVLLGSRLGYVGFECSLTCNEIPSWIRCKEEGASLSFQFPTESNTLEFVGLLFWVVIIAFPGLSCDYFVSIETSAFKMNRLLSFSVQLEMEEISILHFIPRYHLEDIKAGEVVKVTPITKIRIAGSPTSIEACMMKKIGAEALYIDKYGVRQFVPLIKSRSQ
ncbi:PREDICTED: TMV resistance protein N-like isoform X2 [Ipomoea nil]|uniref:TMV resistance protein N-like isoform X2 n=1 Tax=Ipomoea nil TaxID=35883 RepID=UPI000901A66F|nr:PREDICTED: TMV resistance protein N-like isoform X2 [Ipomoea nil]